MMPQAMEVAEFNELRPLFAPMLHTVSSSSWALLFFFLSFLLLLCIHWTCWISGMPCLLDQRVLQLPSSDHHPHDCKDHHPHHYHPYDCKDLSISFVSKHYFSGGLQSSDRPGSQVPRPRNNLPDWGRSQYCLSIVRQRRFWIWFSHIVHFCILVTLVFIRSGGRSSGQSQNFPQDVERVQKPVSGGFLLETISSNWKYVPGVQGQVSIILQRRWR